MNAACGASDIRLSAKLAWYQVFDTFLSGVDLRLSVFDTGVKWHKICVTSGHRLIIMKSCWQVAAVDPVNFES